MKDAFSDSTVAAPPDLTGSRSAMVEARHLGKTFELATPWVDRVLRRDEPRRIHAVDDVSFSIEPGRTLALVGESGCGKSTLARMMVGLERPSSGSARLDGADIEETLAGPRDAARAMRRRMQMIFQDPYASLNPRWRVADIVAEPLLEQRLLPAADVPARVIELLASVGLKNADTTRFPHQFSGGQRQRISIARALASRPEFLVCDEPTSALDVSVQAQVLNLMVDLQRERALTCLFISHNLVVVRYVSDEVPRAAGGAGAEAGAVLRAAPSVHAHAAGRDPRPAHERAPARAGARRGAEPARAAVRLRVPPALPACERAVPGRAADDAAVRRGARGLPRGRGRASRALNAGAAYLPGETTPVGAGTGSSVGIGGTAGGGGMRSSDSGELGTCAAGRADVPCVAGRNSGPFWPQPASSDSAAAPATTAPSASARIDPRPSKTAPGAGGRRAAKLDAGHSFIRRILSTMATSTLHDTEYHDAADRLLAAIERQCDEWLQQGVIDIDSNRAGSLLELAFPNGSRIVVNKQPPLQEIWLAARQGGYHFKFSDGRWRDTRDGVDFFVRLSDEAGLQGGRPLPFVSAA